LRTLFRNEVFDSGTYRADRIVGHIQYEGGYKRRQEYHQYDKGRVIYAVFKGGQDLLEVFVKEVIKYRRDQIGAEAQVGTKSKDARDPFARLSEFDILDDGEEKHGKEQIKRGREICVRRGHEFGAEAAVEVIYSHKRTAGQKEGDAVSQLNVDSVFLKVSARKIIGKGIKVFPPIGYQRGEKVDRGRGVFEESLGVKIKGVENSRQSGEQKKRSDEEQLLLF